jgi:hypothetical protein
MFHIRRPWGFQDKGGKAGPFPPQVVAGSIPVTPPPFTCCHCRASRSRPSKDDDTHGGEGSERHRAELTAHHKHEPPAEPRIESKYKFVVAAREMVKA